MLNLTKAQHKFIAQKDLYHTVLKGEKASGTTHIAIGRMLYLANYKCQQEQNLLFVTCEDEINDVKERFYEEYNKQTMSLFETGVEPASIMSIDALIEGFYRELCKDKKQEALEVIEDVPQKVLKTAVQITKKLYPRVKFLHETYEAFIREEINWINSQGYDSFEIYSKAPRKGASIKLPKNGKGRQALWKLKVIIDEMLGAENKLLKLVMQGQVVKEITRKPIKKYTHIIASEVQVFTKVQLQCMALLYDGGELLLIMDKKTSSLRHAWLKPGQTFKQVGMDMTGRIRNLRVSEQRKAPRRKKQVENNSLTPLECFMADLLKAKQTKVKKKLESKKVKQLPWYVESYRYVNKLTGVETVFQKDTSAGETYIDEVKQENVEALPLYSSDIAAGAPIEIVEEVSDTFEIPSELLYHRRNTYMLHVQGDSMIGANIDDGDYVVIQAGSVNNNEIAAVYYNGATTLKRITQEEEHVLLISENPKYEPIVIEDGDFRVMGKLIGVIKPITN